MNTDTDTVEEMQEVTAPMDAVMESEPVEEKVEEKVPLSALQKERKKRQDWEQRAKMYEQREAQQISQQAPVQDEEDQYEAITKAEYKKGKSEIIRDVMEATWAKENPEKVEEVNEKLVELIKQRPHLKFAIEAAPNRYEEAYTLLNAMSPKQQAALKPQPVVKKPTPGSPNAVPKAAGINQTVDVMSMSDSEYNTWRAAQRKRR